MGQSNLEERIKGYQDEFKANYPGIEVVQIIDDQRFREGRRWPEGRVCSATPIWLVWVVLKRLVV